MRQTLFSFHNSILKKLKSTLQTRSFDVLSTTHLVVGSVVSRELSSIFIPNKKDYNSPAATFSNLFLDRPSSLVGKGTSPTLASLSLEDRDAHSLPSRERMDSRRRLDVKYRRSVSRHAGNRFRSGDEKRTPRIDSFSLSLSIEPAADSIFVPGRHNFPFACALPNSRPTFRAFR